MADNTHPRRRIQRQGWRRRIALAATALTTLVLSTSAAAHATSPEEPQMTCHGSAYLVLPVAPPTGTYTQFYLRVNGGDWVKTPEIYYTEGRGGNFASYRWDDAGREWHNLGSFGGPFDPGLWVRYEGGDTVEAWAATWTDQDSTGVWKNLGACTKSGYAVFGPNGSISISPAV